MLNQLIFQDMHQVPSIPYIDRVVQYPALGMEQSGVCCYYMEILSQPFACLKYKTDFMILPKKIIDTVAEDRERSHLYSIC